MEIKVGDIFRFYSFRSVAYPILSVDEEKQTVTIESFRGEVMERSFYFLKELGFLEKRSEVAK